MANTVLIKRSAVAAKVPLTTDLALGELAINTFDGKVYMKKDDGTASIVQVGGGGSAGLSPWVLKTSSYTAVNGDRILADTSSGSFTITLPGSPALGDSIQIGDSGDWGTNNLTVAPNGSTIEGIADDLLLDVQGAVIDLVYSGTTWQVYASVGTGTASLATLTSAQTLTNKRINPRVNNNGTTTSGTIAPTSDNSDQYDILGLTGAITIETPSGTPVNGQKLMLKITDDGTSRTIDWNTISGGYRVIGTVLPTTTANKTIYVGCIYNTEPFTAVWDVVAVTAEA